jgi:hypothetical protein
MSESLAVYYGVLNTAGVIFHAYFNTLEVLKSVKATITSSILVRLDRQSILCDTSNIQPLKSI